MDRGSMRCGFPLKDTEPPGRFSAIFGVMELSPAWWTNVQKMHYNSSSPEAGLRVEAEAAVINIRRSIHGYVGIGVDLLRCLMSCCKRLATVGSLSAGFYKRPIHTIT